MADLYHVIAAPRKAEESRTKRLAAEFFSVYRSENPGHKIEKFDLTAADLPELDGVDVNTKRAWGAGDELSNVQRERKDEIDALIEPLKEHDRLVITAPMWNFNVPWTLKRWIDAIVWPGETFTYTEQGPKGLLDFESTAVISTKGGSYDDGNPNDTGDYFTGYMNWILGFVGIGDPAHVTFEGTDSLGGDDYEEAFDAAQAEARELARDF